MAKILVVDDSPLNRDVLTRRLTRRGYEVICAAGGEQAMAMTRSESPDLVLMDLRLPDVSGWDAASSLKSDPATRGIPIIALSANTMDGERDKAIHAGCDDYDAKPVEMDRLIGKIEKLLRKVRTGGLTLHE